MEKQIIVYSYNRILLSNKNTGSTDTHNSISESQKHYDEQKKTDTEISIMYDFIYLKIQKDNLNLQLESMSVIVWGTVACLG